HGIEVLKDARTRVIVRDEILDLVGIRFWTKRLIDIAALTRGATGTVVLLAHDPRRLVEAEALNIPLVLSGHTHGGQVVLPIVIASGYSLCSSTRIRADSVSTVSSPRTGTAACRTIGPLSRSALTRWTVAPEMRTPCSSACCCASIPGNDGRRDG